MLRAPFVPQFVALVPDVLVYQIQADADTAALRLRRRGEGDAELRARLDGYDGELAAGRHLAHRTFVNDGDLDSVVAAVSGALAVAA
jgi:ribose 1,5-bisphosphokinase PhnN